MVGTGNFSLRTLMVVIVAIAINLAILIPLVYRSVRMQRSVECTSNLRVLWQASLLPWDGVPFGDLGSARFLDLQLGDRQWHDYRLFTCPYSNDPLEAGRTSYRGPAMSTNSMKDGDPVAADKEGNHGAGRGGTVLNKAGDCFEVQATDPAWIRARTTTRE